ncbi:hypothetical protein SEA_SLOOPYJOE_1 [Arthrobacter phage Sloopyjoe]|nr:hypothetical protein PBI_STAYER_1 [Arthrobacter phage Stayer]QFG09711.1 hypothetical protein PBI_SHIBA_1 [Arthrobacter phage Shiba]QFG10146.1 hypothetical protein PBI_EGAD_1 [Arthrobacter phage Egad]QFG11716.1 hypothetical protein PBI_SALK_1 [Arthrobacter phage Salk]QFG12599.1 hypothetical protein PBI_MICHELLE_1 [Arthrobacter phage Michelle]QFG14372.1 hypothetical protein PBI_STARLORD_1 [Arthrobacter phage StarLord]UVT31080.1 hypothetical protein PBI_LINDA_1 [Arthrobacter phage Linda]WAB0
MSTGISVRVYWIPTSSGFIYLTPFKSHFGGNGVRYTLKEIPVD